MKREEFVEWLEKESCYSRRSDYYWVYLVDYADYIWDEVRVYEDKVVFVYEDRYFGGSSIESVDYIFEEFIKCYNNDSLK